MVWYHGGSFQAGVNFSYVGYFLASADVIVVTVNYRLGIMGETICCSVTVNCSMSFLA